MFLEATLATATAEAAILSPATGLGQLFQEHYGLVFRTAYRITGSASDAEDVLQTVFLRLAGRDVSAPLIENSESYLRRAAINAALDLVRARQESEPLAESLPERRPAEADRRELQDCLRRSLARLSRREAEVFTLRFLEGRSNIEIARTLGASQVWVAVTVHRTRRRLQKEIRSYWRGGL